MVTYDEGVTEETGSSSGARRQYSYLVQNQIENIWSHEYLNLDLF